jgi:3-(3-hydroxy-phenyl)propionate hydroxylase
VRRYTTIIKGLGRIICERDPVAARARDQRLLAEAGGTVQTVPRQHLLPPIETGFIAADAHSANGTLFPQPRVQSRNGIVLMDEVCGTGFRIVVDARFPISALRRRDLVERLGATVVRIGEAPGTDASDGTLAMAECDGVMANWFERYRCTAAIVRPDHYVYGVAASAASLDDHLERIGKIIQG